MQDSEIRPEMMNVINLDGYYLIDKKGIWKVLTEFG
jgi:hypothetical protein